MVDLVPGLSVLNLRYNSGPKSEMAIASPDNIAVGYHGYASW